MVVRVSKLLVVSVALLALATSCVKEELPAESPVDRDKVETSSDEDAERVILKSLLAGRDTRWTVDDLAIPSEENGWKLILWFAVVLNVNLAVLNILPLPIVDGGHVVLGTLEIIFRRPVGGKLLEWIQSGFLFLLLFFFLFVTFKDVGDMVGGPEEKAPKLPEPVFSK